MPKKQIEPTEQKQVSFKRLVYESLPEMWSFQFFLSLMIVLPAFLLRWLLSLIAESSGVAMTTANLKDMLLSWRAPLLLVLGVALILLYIIMELFSQIHMSDDILKGQRVRTFSEIGKGIRGMRKILNPTGILVLLYIFIAVPLCGIGFSISLTETFYIPNFIIDVVMATPLYAVAYSMLIVCLIVVGIRSIFTVHAVLIDGMSPREGMKASSRLIRNNRKAFITGMIKTILALAAIQIAVYMVFTVLPCAFLEKMGALLPTGYQFDVLAVMNGAKMTETDTAVVFYRFLCFFVVMMGVYLNSIAILLSGSYLMLRFTRYYLEFTREESSVWLERPKKSRYRWKVAGLFGMAVVILIGSFMLAFFYNPIFDRTQNVRIIAHRAGGTLASENSVEGLNTAMEHGCYASEIDVQRTKDGYYIINHDNDFKRLTGVAKTPQEMTLDEIRALKILDITGNGKELQVPTFEEMLDAVKGRGKLFIELKGATADRQMVDDLVRIIREKDCVKDVVLISLSYDVIDYAESIYPEFETGTLFFAGIGDVARLNCDILIMEEEMATSSRIDSVHESGKTVIVWTVNSESGMYKFLNSNVDGVITDEIELAQRTQETLDHRTELQVIQDAFTGAWD